MRLPYWAIKHYQFTVVIILMLVVLGLSSFLSMPRSEDPQFDFAYANISAAYPGTSAVDMEKLVVDPIEAAVNQLDDIKQIEAYISDGFAAVEVEFIYGTDPDDAYDDTVQALASIRDQLPANMARLEVIKASPTDVNILQLALVSETETYKNLRVHADTLKKTLQAPLDVKRVEIWGIPEQQVQVRVDLEKMHTMEIAFAEVMGAIQARGENIPGGHVDAGTRRLTVSTTGDFNSVEEIENVIVASRDGEVVVVSDVAEVFFGSGEPTHLVRANGKRAVFVTAIQRKGSNIFTVMEELKSISDDFCQRLPTSIQCEIVFDQSKSVSSKVNGFFITLLQGLLIVGVAVIIALGIRASVAVLVAIPLSIMIAISAVDTFGYGLQEMSIAGLLIALGLLVDNAIVVTENIKRYLNKGYPPLQAAVTGAREVGWAVTSGTATTILAFLPMIMVQSNVGTFLRSMPVTVMVCLLASLLIALTFTPLLTAKIVRPTAGEDRESEPPWFERVLNRFKVRFFQPLVKRSVSRPLISLSIAAVFFGLSVMLLPIVGVSMFPDSDKPQVLIEAELPEGSSFYATDEVARDIEAMLRNYPQIHTVLTNVGRGNPRIFYNESPGGENSAYTQLYVQIDGDGDDISHIIRDFRQRVKSYVGAEIRVRRFYVGPPVEAPIAMHLISDDLQALKSAASMVKGIMRETEGTVNLKNPIERQKIDLGISINEAKAGVLGIPVDSIDRIVRAGLVGIQVSNFRDERGDEYPVNMRLDGSESPSIDNLNHIMVSHPGRPQTDLAQLARWELKTASGSFRHRDLMRSTLVTAEVEEGYQVERVTNAIIDAIETRGLPAGVRLWVGGEKESREDSFGSLGQALVIALFGIFSVLVLQFGTFSQPLIVFIAIPFAFSGAVLGLFFSGNTFSFMAFVGLTSLMGIVVNNSIILVDYANQLRRQGAALADAVEQAAMTRFQPIVLTTITTIGSMIPVILSGHLMFSPLAWVITGGLLVSTLLTLLLVPALYKLLSPGVLEEGVESEDVILAGQSAES